jgi:membrane-bound lytic murein transglycosylase B
LHNGGDTPTYIAGTDNFFVITRYNRSSYYALAVIDLGLAVENAMADSVENSTNCR